jgi:hypothetical protein
VFDVATTHGMEPQAGLIRGCWGVRRYRAEPITGWEYYGITHIPTGRYVAIEISTAADAKRMADRIIAAGDWSAIDGPQHPDTARLKAVVRGLEGEA